MIQSVAGRSNLSPTRLVVGITVTVAAVLVSLLGYTYQWRQ